MPRHTYPHWRCPSAFYFALERGQHIKGTVHVVTTEGDPVSQPRVQGPSSAYSASTNSGLLPFGLCHFFNLCVSGLLQLRRVLQQQMCANGHLSLS